MQVSLFSLVFRASDEDASARNDRAAVARAWQGHLPTDVFVRRPMERRFVLLGDTVAVRSAECGPVPSDRGSRHGEKKSRPDAADPPFPEPDHSPDATLSETV